MRRLIWLLGLGLLLAACGNSESESYTFIQITMEEAAQRMAEETDYIILDVRTAEEFAEGHIPGAINVPNETIGTAAPEELPRKDQLIFIYCRSGNRSVTAAKKLLDLGYTNLYEIGGIIDWTGELETE